MASSDPFAGGTQATLEFDKSEPIKYDSLKELLTRAIESVLGEKEAAKVRFDLSAPDFVLGSSRAYSTWTVKIAMPPERAGPLLDKFAQQLGDTPVFLGDSHIGARVAGAPR